MGRKHLIGLLAGMLLCVFCATGSLAAEYPKLLRIPSGAVSGVFYIWSMAWGNLITEKLGIKCQMEASTGAVGGFKMIQSGQGDFAMCVTGIAWDGYNGSGWAKGEKQQNVRALFPCYASYLQWVSPASQNINSLKDFGGKRVCFGPATAPSYVYGNGIMELLGVKPSKVVRSPFNEIADQIKDGLADIGLVTLGVPAPVITEYASGSKATVGGVPKDLRELIIKKYPFFGEGVVPANSYPGQDKAFETLTMWSEMLCHKSLPDDLVYDIVKMTYENVKTIGLAYKRSETETALENVKFITSIPLHPGAIRYYKEKGVDLPASAYPPEYK